MKELNLKKFEYKPGRILNTIISKDGLVRTLEVKFARNKLPVLRDIKKCALLEHDFTQSSLAERSKALPGERLCTKIHKETVAESQLSSTRKKSRKICLQ